MTRTFRVAGHLFSVIMPEDHPLAGKMAQYGPFEVADAAEEPLLTLELVDRLPDIPAEKVYGGSEEEGQPVIELFRAGETWIYEMAVCSGRPVCARMHSDSSFSRGRLQILNPEEGLFGLNNALMLLFAFRTAGLGTLEMHASVIVNGGRAFLWLAKSGTGKSTHSRMWLENVPGSRLLNDDNPIVRVLDDGTVEVYGSPWSGKTPCYRNEHYPAGAFVQIRRSPDNVITRLSVLESYALLYSSSSGFKSDAAMADGLHATFEKIISRIPCYALDCRPDADAARVCSAELIK